MDESRLPSIGSSRMCAQTTRRVAPDTGPEGNIMTIRTGRLAGLACALLALALVSQAKPTAAAPASAFGPPAQLYEPRDGFVGRLDVVPDHGKAGTPFTVVGERLPPNQEFQLIWRTVDGHWKVTESEYKGRE